jgi:hypothetical protein
MLLFSILLIVAETNVQKQNNLTTCYKAYFILFPLAQICISYRREKENLIISSIARTTSFGNIVKRISNFGWSIIYEKELKPKKFFYHQDEIGFKRDQLYIFKDGKIYVKKTLYGQKEKDENIEDFKEYPQDDFLDPHTASITLYREAIKYENGTIKMFYEDKYYYISFRVIGEDIAKSELGNFKTRVVEVEADVETKGPIKPKGKWIIWLDVDKTFPVKMQLNFTLGSLKVEIEKIEGDANLLKKVLQNTN